ncbi:MAG: LysR family transcriptional regulator [Sphingomonas fennica]
MNLYGFDARHLAILDMLLTECHVGRTAARLHLSQPAVSNTLAWLRRHFDDPLLVRRGGALRPTPFAERLRDPVRRLLVDLRALVMVRPSFEAPTATRHFRITISQYAAAMLLEPLLARIAADAPGITIECRPTSGDVNEFERGEIDLLVVPWDVLHAGHPRQMLFADEWQCAACAHHPDSPAVLDAAAYRTARHVVPDMQQAIGWELDALGVHRNVAAIVPHAQVVAAVRGSPWIVTMPGGYLRQQAAPDVRILPLPFAVSPLVIGIQWHREAQQEPASHWLRDQIRQAAADAHLPPPVAAEG